MAFHFFLSRLSSSFPSSSRHIFSRPLLCKPLLLLTSNTPSRTRPPPTFLFCFSTSLLAAVTSVVVLDDLRSNPSHCDSTLDHKSGVQGSHRKVPEELVEELKTVLKTNLSLDHDERYFHGKPQNSFHKAINIPDVVVYPTSQEDVVKIVSACNKHKVPIIPYGGATSVEGHTLAPNGGVCVDMSLMKSIKELHVEDMDVVVEPGIGWTELNEYLKPFGLFFPLDPGPGASVGGMCATRCSGSLAVRYGTMRDNVISLKAVLGNGEVIKTSSRARKSSSGYDLTRLLVGSEGTLGVITEVTLRLQKLPQHSVVAMCNFPTVKDAADVAIATMLSGIQVSRVELMDEVQVKAINLANGKNFPEAPTLMFEFIGTEVYCREQAMIVQKIVGAHNGLDFLFVDDPEAKKELWQIRKEALWACFAMEPNSEAMITDVCVPLSHLADCISKSKEKIDESPLTCSVIAHAGDGNFHSIILFDPKKEEQRQEAERLNHFMVSTALSMEVFTFRQRGKQSKKTADPTAKKEITICRKSTEMTPRKREDRRFAAEEVIADS